MTAKTRSWRMSMPKKTSRTAMILATETRMSWPPYEPTANSPDRLLQSPDHESGLCVVQLSLVRLANRGSVNHGDCNPGRMQDASTVSGDRNRPRPYSGAARYSNGHGGSPGTRSRNRSWTEANTYIVALPGGRQPDCRVKSSGNGGCDRRGAGASPNHGERSWRGADGEVRSRSRHGERHCRGLDGDARSSGHSDRISSSDGRRGNIDAHR